MGVENTSLLLQAFVRLDEYLLRFHGHILRIEVLIELFDLAHLHVGLAFLLQFRHLLLGTLARNNAEIIKEQTFSRHDK